MRKALGVLILFSATLSVFTLSTTPSIAQSSLNNFKIKDFQIDYYLDRDNERRSSLKTVESIQADFPKTDQNHGLERSIPSSYDGHSVNLKIVSVTNENGIAQQYSTYSSNDNTVLRIGDADSYVHGIQNYIITYTQRDVTRFYNDTNMDEFYWDINGIDWAVPIESLSANLHLANNLSSSLTNNQKCYQGFNKSAKTCDINSTDDGFKIDTQSLKANENVTIAVGFEPGTFAQYKKTTQEVILGLWIALLSITFVASVILIIWLTTIYYRRTNRTSEIGTVVAEYLPPENTSVSTSGSVVNKPKNAFSAQLIDFAVRHYIKIYQTQEKSLFKSANYELEVIKNVSDLKPEEQEILRDIFGDPHIGARYDMKKLKGSTKFAAKISDNKKKLDKSINGEYGLRARNKDQSAWFKKIAIIILILSVIFVSPWLLTVSIISFVFSSILKPLTDKGLELARYLKGLELYIKTAEAERLRYLQSPEGALKLGETVDANNNRQLVKLYEKVLPYAILFGQEKEWNKRIGEYYNSLGESPGWYSGDNTVFNAVIFSSIISDFNTTASYSNPSSSSSGGSGGGGFSGGGGGGGGGGGW